MGQTAEELLNSLTEDEIATYTADPATEPHIIVDSERFISVPETLRRIAVQFDHDIETVTFDCPRFWDGHDMSKMAIYINYLTSGGVRDSYYAQNVTVDENDETIMHFDWTISRNVTQTEGTVNFLVCVKKTDEEGNEVNHWNSELCQNMYVSQGLECSEVVAETYSDLITLILLRMDELGEILTMTDDGNGNVSIEGMNSTLGICDAFNDKETYEVDDFVLYLGTLYKCIVPVEKPGLFTPANWEETAIVDELSKCFQSVSDGKELVASAITDMGVTTEATAEFAVMANNIRSIQTGVVAGGDAQPEDVAAGKSFINNTGYLLYGTSTAATDLANLQAVYDDLVVDLEESEAEKETLQTEKDKIQAAYDEYKAAVVDGLQYSGLGVTKDTTAAELKAILLAAFPDSVPYTVNFADYPITLDSCTVGINAADAKCSNLSGTGFYLQVKKGTSLNNFGTLTCTVNLPTQKCNTVAITYKATGTDANINSQGLTADGNSHSITLNCTGSTFDLAMGISQGSTELLTTLTITEIRFYNV